MLLCILCCYANVSLGGGEEGSYCVASLRSRYSYDPWDNLNLPGEGDAEPDTRTHEDFTSPALLCVSRSSHN
jgi:hypothetical protein